MEIYRTKDGDVLDDIVARYYGDQENRIVELVLEANPGLADLGPIMPAGVDVVMPERPPVVARRTTKLWD
jgi:phage tail protein X